MAAGPSYNSFELLAWLNDTLQTSFTRAEQLCTGAAYCQLMDWLFPGSLDLSRVRFQSSSLVDCIHNYSLLQAAFRRGGVPRLVPTEALMKRNPAAALNFLQWFRRKERSRGREYHALEARGGQSMAPADPDGVSQAPRQTVEIILKMEEPRTEKPRAEEVVVISDDDELMVVETEEQPPDKMETVEKEEEQEEVRNYSVTIGPVSFPEDVVQACSLTPYCLYLYTGAEPDGGQRTGTVLVGYFEQSSGVSVVRLLCTLQMSMRPQRFVDLDKETARLLLDVLKTSRLCLSNLAVFYCDAPRPQAIEAQLRAHSPGLLSLCGLPGVAGRACESALAASFAHVVDLVGDVQRHCSSHHVTGHLEELFGRGSYDPALPVSAQCLAFIRTVLGMASGWRELVKHFSLLRRTPETQRVRAQLMDCRVQLHLLFLSQALEPLRCIEEVQQKGDADVVAQLRLTSALVRSYAANVFQPLGAKRFVRRPELRLLRGGEEMLPASEVNIGCKATDFLWATAEADLGEPERSAFLEAAKAFYRSVLRSVVQSVPQQLGQVGAVSTALKHPGGFRDPQWSRAVLADLGLQLRLCKVRSPEVNQLVLDYLRFAGTLDEQGGGPGGCSWAQRLSGVQPHSALHRLLLTLLALPGSLCRKHVFSKMAPPPDARQPAPWKLPIPGGYGREKKEEEDDRSLSDYAFSFEEEPHVEEHTDDSLGVVEISEDSDPGHVSRRTEADPLASIEIFLDSDDDDEDDDKEVTPSKPSGSTGHLFSDRALVWGVLRGLGPCPAVIQACEGQKLQGKRTLKWFGQQMSSQVSLLTLKPFAAFGELFCSSSFAALPSYKEAIFLSLEEAALRCKKRFPAPPEDKATLLMQMVSWALAGFQPTGPAGFRPKASVNGDGETAASSSPRSFNSSPPASVRSAGVKVGAGGSVGTSTMGTKGSRGGQEGAEPKGGWGRRRGKGGWRGGRRKKSSGFDDDTSPNFVPHKRRSFTQTIKVKEASSVYTQPDQKLREEKIRKTTDMDLDIEGLCLCCGTDSVETSHPLFKGGLCSKCKHNFTETLHRYDDDGYQSYCTICCYGLEVILCGNDSCCRSFCEDCLNILVGPGTFDSLRLQDPWICFLCQPHRAHGALTPREDWSVRVQEAFANKSAMAFEPHRVYPSVPANLRRPLRVLSLFDGIATGFLVLKDLGFKVEKYVASEVCEDSMAVAAVNHDGKIIQVGDARFITQEHLEEWGQFDLLIGGSPCNDLSIVNPFRKGIYEGTGRLFFEFYRILQLLKPKEGDSRPFFWLFENVVFMNTHDKVNICRFLECNPVVVDAVRVSPAHRARHFWGNIPGMGRPIAACQSDRLCLQDCLEVGREARVTKVRTITTNPNSLKQGKDVSLLPVLHNGQEDNLWITELEKIFGFPKHYTDVRNMNRQQRQKVLGKAWSVPVVRHLFAPLKDYFACEELLTTPTSHSSQSAPASPGPQNGWSRPHV